MKEAIVTFLVCVSILSMSASFLYLGADNRRKSIAKINKKCVPCESGMKRKKEDCACPANQRVEKSRQPRPLPQPKSSLDDRLRTAFRRTGCSKTLTESNLLKFKEKDGFGIKQMFDTCTMASNGVEDAIAVCGNAVRCQLVNLNKTFDDVKNKFKYSEKEKTTLYGPTYGSFETFDRAKDHCDRTLRCKGVVYDDVLGKFDARGGDTADSRLDITWLRGEFM